MPLSLEHRHLSRLIVFDLGNLAAKPDELAGGEMPGDGNAGRDAHPPTSWYSST